MQLADKTVVATVLAANRGVRLIRFDEGSDAIARQNAAMTVGGLRRRPVQDEGDEQQTQPTLKSGPILQWAEQHAGHGRMC